jgi:hypothetical protein
MDDELKTTQKEVVVTYFKLPPLYLTGGTKEHRKRPQSVYQTVDLNAENSRIRSRTFDRDVYSDIASTSWVKKSLLVIQYKSMRKISR